MAFPVVMYVCESWTIKKAEHQRIVLTCSVGEDSWESLGQQGSQTSQSLRKLVLNSHWKDWSWSSNTFATWCEELTCWKRPWCWERLKAGGEGDDRVWDGWMASPTRWMWVWAGFWNWWWTGLLACCNPWDRKESDGTEQLNCNCILTWEIPCTKESGGLQSIWLQRVGHDLAGEQ